MKSSIQKLWQFGIFFAFLVTGCSFIKTPTVATASTFPPAAAANTPLHTSTLIATQANLSPASTITTAPTITHTQGPTRTAVPKFTNTPAPTATPANFATEAANCQNNAMTTVDINSCVSIEKEGYDQLLDQLVLELKGIIGPEKGAELDSVQRKWQAYVKADCDWYFHIYEEGTMRTMMELSCYIVNDKDRIRSLSWLLCGDEPNCPARKKYIIGDEGQ